MKTIYFAIAVLLLSFTSCKKSDGSEDNQDNAVDSTAIRQNSETKDTVSYTPDTTSTAKDTATATTNDVDAKSNVNLPNKISETTKVIPGEKGKYPLAETKWKLVELNGKPVTFKTGPDYFINFDSKSGTFRAYAGCNNISGKYFMKSPNNKLAFTNIMITRKACSEMDTERDFFNNLQKVDNYMIEDKMMHLHIGKKAVAKFEAIR